MVFIDFDSVKICPSGSVLLSSVHGTWYICMYNKNFGNWIHFSESLRSVMKNTCCLDKNLVNNCQMFIRCPSSGGRGDLGFLNFIFEHLKSSNTIPLLDLLMENLDIFWLQIWSPRIPPPLEMKLIMENFDIAETSLCTGRLPSHS